MVKVAFLGSCLSASITKALISQQAEVSLVAFLSHFRSDVFCELFRHGSKVERLPLEQIKVLLKEYGSEVSELKNNSRADNQSSERLQRFRKALPKIDILIIDTNYDLSLTVYDDLQDSSLVGLSLLPKKELIGQRLKPRPPLPIKEVVSKLKEMVDLVRLDNPDLHIALINYPSSGFAQVKRADRIMRTDQLNQALLSAKLNVQFIPALTIPKAEILPKGEHYFTDSVYEIYADTIFTAYKTKEWMNYGANLMISDLDKLDNLHRQLINPNVPQNFSLPKGMRTPYDTFPKRNFWRDAVAEKFPLSVDDIYDKKFDIKAEDAIATCGSCFAQHIGRRLNSEGFNVLDVEQAPADILPNERTSRGYGIYSARYGNVYTARQLLQIFEQAFSDDPLMETWESKGRYYDPFRPNLDPEGFATPIEVNIRRKVHLREVRRMFQELNLFVFTMGLTEAWKSKVTGAVYPLCPGASVGHFDPELHDFVNFTYEEVKADMVSFWEKLRHINPNARMLLTVSPVPLTATAENQHVLVSTIHSKSILRAVAGSMASSSPDIDYFPSYEIITGPNFRSMFYTQNLRNIQQEGVDFVMSHFFKQHTRIPKQEATSTNIDTEDLCDEILLDVSRKETAL